MSGIRNIKGFTKAIVLQVAVAILVDHDPPLATRSLSDENACSGQASGVVLDKLHVLQGHPSPIGQGHAVAGFDGTVGGEGEDPSGSTRTQNDRLGENRLDQAAE